MVPSADAADEVCGTGTVGPAVFAAAGRLDAVVVSGWRRRPGTGCAIAIKALAPAVQVMGSHRPPHLTYENCATKSPTAAGWPSPRSTRQPIVPTGH